MIFTATQFARALGRTRQAVLRLLSDVAVHGQVIVHGKPVNAWLPTALPAHSQDELKAAAQRHGYRTTEDFLSAPVKLWEPKVPLSELHQDCIEYATKLQGALAASLGRIDGTMARDDFEQLGIQDYKAVFKKVVTQRYWRELFKRTVDRDGGNENWSRLEIYLPEQLKRKMEIAEAFSAAIGEELRELYEVIMTFRVRTAPSTDEKSLLWLRAFELFEHCVEAGEQRKRFRLKILKFLWKHAPWLAKSSNALRVSFDTKYQQWTEGERTAASLVDGRAKRRGIAIAEPFEQKDLDKIVWRAVSKCGGRVSQAVRELIEEDEMDYSISKYFIARRSNKSAIPTRLREAVRHDVAALGPIHQGPRATEKMIPALDLSYEEVGSMEIVQADDFTMPVYFRVPDGAGWWRLTRGQVLLAVDWRSLRALGFCLYPEGQYNSALIRTLFVRVFDKWGLPRALYLERGIWKRSKLITGGPKAAKISDNLPFSEAQVELGLRQYGIEMIHARRARSKPVERVGGLVQDRMEGEPGYCGRDEKKDRPEALTKWMRELERRNPEALNHFLTEAEWELRLEKILNAYNAARQDGKRLGGFSPEAVFEALWQENERSRFDDSCRYLLALHKVPVTVKIATLGEREGCHGLVEFDINGENFRYADGQTGARAGEKLIAFFNPEAPELCTFTDMKYQNPFSVKRLEKVNGARIGDTFKGEVAKVQSAVAHAKARYRLLKSTFEPKFRQNVVSRSVAELGQHIERETATAQATETRRDRRVKEIRNTAQRLEIPSVLLGDDEETRAALEMMEAAHREHEEKSDL